MGIPYSHHPTIVVLIGAVLDFHDAKVALAFMAQRMSE
jgi:hypothetical protein